MASSGGMWAPVAMRVLRQAIGTTAKMSKALSSKLGSIAVRPLNSHVPITVRAGPYSTGAGGQPIHPLALLRQQKQRTALRWYSTGTGARPTTLRNTFRRLINGVVSPATQQATRVDRAQFLRWNTSRAVLQHNGRAPFANTLRPNLTGGALPRTAGGYAVPGSGRVGGARYFSHTPTVQAQVVNDVAQAFRAFWLSGQRARFDGYDARGQRKYRAVSAVQDDASRKMAATANKFGVQAGSYIDFRVSPTITALSPLAAAFPFAMRGDHELAAAPSLNKDGLLELLSCDFERTLSDLAAVMSDLKRLAALGDLPLLLEKNHVIRVRFPGVDAETVVRLCEDLEVQRGVVGQDEDFVDRDDRTALRFPFAPDTAEAGRALSSPAGSLRSHQSELSSELSSVLLEDAFVDEMMMMEENSWLHSANDHHTEEEGWPLSSSPGWQQHDSQQRQQQRVEEFDGLEGIYRFLQECDRAAPRF